ncbi:MAG: 30S ribosomal protein S6 [Patescibacteria group bacterium]|jgi:ribosomal protein S6|nr:30S ribosomal protein S6 [Patescibacteria group bacterium]
MNKKVYEIGCLLSGRLTEAELSGQIEKIKNAFQSVGAQLLKEAEFNKINLSYPIKKETEAYFGYFWFELEPDKLADFKEQLSYEKNILRYLIVTPPPKYKKLTSQPKLAKESKSAPQPISEIAAASEEKKPEPDFEKLEEKLEEIQKLV